MEAASKIILQTDDALYSSRGRGLRDMEQLEVTVTEEGKSISQVPTVGVANIQLYANDIDNWFQHAQFVGAAFDPLMGKEAASGTTFRGQERVVAQGRGVHDKRRGQRAKFVEKIYREWIIPDMVKEILKGKEFLASLSSEELFWVVDEVVENQLQEVLKGLVLSGQLVPDQNGQELIKQQLRTNFLKQGDRYPLEILKDEFKDIEVKMGISVGNKQKNMADLSDKVLSIFQFVFQNPQAFQQAMQIPALAKSFENILEFSGLSIGNFHTLLNPISQPMAQPQQMQPQPLAINR